jgi:predicted nuclease of predicted toxin-antitoxin system
MRFLVDECTGPQVARWLREQGHDVFSVYERSVVKVETLKKLLTNYSDRLKESFVVVTETTIRFAQGR